MTFNQRHRFATRFSKPAFILAAALTAISGSAAAASAFDVIQAEAYSSMKGIQSGGGAVGSFDNGDYLVYKSVDFGTGASAMTLKVGVPASYAGQKIEVRIDGLQGTILGTLAVQATSGWMNFSSQTLSIKSVSGVHNLYLIARGSYGVANLDSFQFSRLVAVPAPAPAPAPAPSSVPQGLPDVVVTSISTIPAQPIAGQPVKYSAQITNLGSAPTPAGTILGVSFSTDGGQYLWSDTQTASLAPGASVTLTTNGGEAGTSTVTLSSGTHSVRAFVNDVNRFAESNTSNNTKDLSVNVASASLPASAPAPAPAPAPTPVPVPAPAPSTGSVGTASPYGQDPSRFTLTFQDEFEGSSLDTNKWRDHIWYDPASSTKDYGVSNGSLKIWPQRDSSGQFKERILVTDGKFYQTYGYFEIEAKLPIGKGCWPAFWLLNSDNPDAGEPEIDIMEAYSGDTGGYWADSNLHPIRYEATFFQNGANFPGLQQSTPKATPDLSADFHKFAVLWEPNRISFYFDGVLVSSSAVSMNKRMYILLDMQYGSASGSADNSTPTGPGNSFEVKYVRAWQLK